MSDRADSTFAFELLLPGVAALDDLFGLWQVKSVDAASAQPLAGLEPSGGVWRASLPDDRIQAEALLDAFALKQSLFEQVLPGLPWSLQSDLVMISAGNTTTASFSTPRLAPPLDPGSPRAALLVAARTARPDQSFGVFDDLFQQGKITTQELKDAGDTIARLIAAIDCSFQQMAQVETCAGGQKIAVTRITAAGELLSWWRSDADPALFALHAKVLSQALQTRQQWLQVMFFLSAGAVSVAAALTTAPFSPLALWVVWKYIQGAVQQVHSLAALYTQALP